MRTRNMSRILRAPTEHRVGAQEERNGFEHEANELHGVFKAVDHNRTADRRLRIGKVPYKEYVAFVEHLRALVPSSPTPPAISTLLTPPFLARLVTEDL